MARSPVNHILVLVDGTKSSFRAADYAIELARAVGARITALAVVDTDTLRQLLNVRILVESEMVEFEDELQDQRSEPVGRGAAARDEQAGQVRGCPAVREQRGDCAGRIVPTRRRSAGHRARSGPTASSSISSRASASKCWTAPRAPLSSSSGARRSRKGLGPDRVRQCARNHAMASALLRCHKCTQSVQVNGGTTVRGTGPPGTSTPVR